MKIVLKNANVFNPHQKLDEKEVDLIIIDGIISAMGKNKGNAISDAKVFDLQGKYIVPGLFDMHVHLREPGREDEETVITGCNSAASGGFTSIACMPNTDPAIDSAEIINFILSKAKSHLVKVHPVAAASLGRKGEYLSPMAELYEAGAVGFSDDGAAIKTASIAKRALEYSKMFNVPIIEHCEDESLAGGAMNEGLNSTILGLLPIPSVAEDLIVARDILLAEYTGGTLHIAHISSKKSIDLVREAKKKGIKVTAEVTPHHFTLTDNAVKGYDTNTKMNPPLRSQEDLQAVIDALADGTIDCIACDHAPHSPEEKDAEFEYAPNGIVGLESSLALALTELYHKKILSFEQLIKKMAINPRLILNISIPKIVEGELAEISIIDLNEVWTVEKNKFLSKSKNSPFDKKLLTGKSVGVINNHRMFFKGEFFSI